MVQVRNGDLDQLGLLFERYHRRLFSYFYRLTWRRDLSEDLVQNVFERILKYRESYSGDGAFSTWIYRIARNIHIDHYREEQRNGATDDFADFDRMESDQLPPDRVGEENPDLLRLKRALQQLDKEKRETLILSRYEGLKYREIAEVMECSESAVKVRIYRALKELNVLMNEMRKEDHHE